MRWLPALLTAMTVALGACSLPGTSEGGSQTSPSSGATSRRQPGPAVTLQPRAPLAGHTVVVDPGHQLGNSRHPAQVNAPVDAGGFTKPCNSTGTATEAGYPEATFTWQVAQELVRRLERLGAEVVLTRSTNSLDDWGPCVDERGRAAARGDLLVSIHGDGNLSASARGFHVIASPDVAGSQALARALRDGLDAAGVQRSTYLGEGGLDLRTDLATLNLAERPAALVELGNMRHPDDAALMTSVAGRATYVEGILRGVRRFLRVGDDE